MPPAHNYIQALENGIIIYTIKGNITEPQLPTLQTAFNFKDQVFTQSPNVQDTFRIITYIVVNVVNEA